MADFKTQWMRFVAWLKDHGFPPTPLLPADFPDTGRGLKATRDFAADSPVVRVPKAILITPQCTLDLFPSNLKIAALNQHASIALFVAWQALHPSPAWSPYMAILPPSFDTLPFYMPPDLLALLPFDIQDTVAKQTSKIDRDYAAVSAALPDDHIPRRVFDWAWFVVNTRCISLNTDTEAAWIDKQPRIALAPFLDCLNHSVDAVITAGLEDDGGHYRISTRVPYAKGEQVFISYGPHDNNMLLAEYGFVVQRNSFNHVVLDREMEAILARMPGVTKMLKDEGMYGEYTVASEDVGYRLLNAMRLVSAAYAAATKAAQQLTASRSSPRRPLASPSSPSSSASSASSQPHPQPHQTPPEPVLPALYPLWRAVMNGESRYISAESDMDAYTRLAAMVDAKTAAYTAALTGIARIEHTAPETSPYAIQFARQVVQEGIDILASVARVIAAELAALQ
ncbi:hypothetical protein BC831DRAFT_449523 [Entophlyctis helioformis]|nr:hypothetical protein BC831DRAFT_449523 [Entophlyctis helioformis]